MRNVNAVLGTAVEVVGGPCGATEEARAGVEGADGVIELARDDETRRGSGGTRDQPKKDVSIAESESS